MPAEQQRPTSRGAMGLWGRRLRAAAQGAPAETAPAQAATTPAAVLPRYGASAPPTAAAFEAGEAADRSGRWASVEIAVAACGVVLAAFLLAVEDCRHWFVVPVFLCGCVTGADAVDWLRQRRSLLDPAGLVGALGTHFFFLAPLLQVAWGYSVAYVVPPDDWRPWLGGMACLNAVGLFLYRFVVSAIGHRPPRGGRGYRALHISWFAPLVAVGLLGSLVLQAWVYSIFGGIGGYVAAYSRSSRDEFQGLGLLSMFAEAFPVLAMLAFVVYVRQTGRGRSWLAILVAVGVFVLLRVFFGGLRGSRAAYVWPLFWMVGAIHLWVRPIPRAFVLGGALLLVGFMYAYGLYKSYGENLSTVIGKQDLTELSRARNRGLDTTILSDLGRADIQSYVLYRLWSPRVRGGFEYAFGRTYVGTAALVVPSRVWPDRPSPKAKEGTELIYGQGTWNSRHHTASFAYGLAGETMLNFGPVAVPVAYAGFGLLVGLVRRWLLELRAEDARMLIAPFVVSLCPFVLIWDSDVTLVYLISQGLVPFIMLQLASSAVRASSGPTPRPRH